MINSIAEKQQQFNAAMGKYERIMVYPWVGHIVSFVNTSLQILLTVLALQKSIGALNQFISFVVAFILADFVNGMVHMYMDNNDNYQSLAGPLIASFHLHHRTPKYTQKPIIEVYWHESGSKIWLALFVVAAVMLVYKRSVNDTTAYFFMYFAILSSVAEVSHYLCHIPAKSKIAGMLVKLRILMSPKYHLRHHMQDNSSYTFLNCVTDPVVDFIAKIMYKGYKNTTDLHYEYYVGMDTKNRS